MNSRKYNIKGKEMKAAKVSYHHKPDDTLLPDAMDYIISVGDNHNRQAVLSMKYHNDLPNPSI